MNVVKGLIWSLFFKPKPALDSVCTPCPSKRKIRLASGLFCLLLFFLTFNLSMHSDLNHDEHQFIASAALLANDGLLPYVDYPYFHMPYLVFIYAGLFLFSPYLFWSAHFFSMLCSWLTLVLSFAIGLRLFEQYKARVRFGMAASGALLLLANPIFTHTSGRSWNHDLPLLLTVLAFMCHTKYLAFRSTNANKWLLLSGLLIGLATGVRLSFAMLAVPFAIVTYLLPTDVESRHAGKALLFFGAGIFLALLPALLLFALAREQFFFGNLTYAELNRRYYDEIRGEGEQITIGSKLLYLGMIIVEQPGNLLLLLLFLATLLLERKRLKNLLLFFRGWKKGAILTPRDSDLLLLFLMQPFLLLGAFAPSPSQKQYFFVMVPFLLLTVLYLLASNGEILARPKNSEEGFANPELFADSAWRFRYFALITVITCLLFSAESVTVWDVFFPSKWYPMKIERDGKRLAAFTQGGKVLTLAPILPLEGELDIYPAFATGPFALRVAPLIPKKQRQKYNLFSEEELFPFLAASPPRAILVGLSDDDKPAEAVLVAYAREHDYVPWELPDDSVVWFSPLIEWGEKIRLGTYTLPSEPLALSPSHREQRITFYLQAIAPIEHNLNILVRLVGRDGNEIWRDEGWPYGSPTSTWEVDEVWPDGHEFVLPADSPPGFYRIELSFYDPKTFEHLPASNPYTNEPLGDIVVVDYLTLGQPNGPTTPLSSPTFLGEQIQLLGADVENEGSRSSEQVGLLGLPLQLRLFWQAQAPIKNNYKVFVHLIGPDGQIISQQDQQPLGGFLPTSLWRANHIIPDDYLLELPPNLPPGSYEIRVGMYNPISLERLPITVGGEAKGDFVLVGQVEIGE